MIEPPLRPAREDECELIARWIRALAAHEGRPEAATVRAPDLLRWCFGERRAAEAFIVEEARTPVGYAIVCTTFATFQGKPALYLEDLLIDSAHRGKGLGERAMRSIARLAVSRGCCAVDWAAVAGNEGAIAFYRRLGAREVGGILKFRLDGDALQSAGGAG